RCGRAIPPCAGCPRGRATWTWTNVGSATSGPSQTDCLNVPVQTKNARFRPCNDRAYRSALAEGYVRLVDWRGEAELSGRLACVATAEGLCATSPAFSARPVRSFAEQKPFQTNCLDQRRRKTRQLRRKGASIFG